MAKLEGDTVIKRLIKVHSIEGEIELSLSVEHGIRFRVPGTKTYLTLPFIQAIGHSRTPATVKSYYMDKPIEFIKGIAKIQDEKAAKKRAEKAGD